MTDRIKSLKVTLETNTREDDCQELVDTINEFANVVKVEKEIFDVFNEIKETSLRDREAEYKIEQARFLKEILGEMEYKVIGFFSNSEYTYKVHCFDGNSNLDFKSTKIIAVLQDKKHSCEIEPPVLISHLVLSRLGSEPECDFIKRVVNTASNILERLYLLNHNLTE